MLKRKLIHNLAILTAPLALSLSGMLILCVTCLCYIGNFLMKKQKLNCNFSSIGGLKMSWFWWILLEKLGKIVLWRRQMNIVFLSTPKDSPLSGTCHIPMLYWEFSHENVGKATITSAELMASNRAFWHPKHYDV